MSNMQAKNKGDHRESHISFESTTAHLKILKNNTLEFTGIVLKRNAWRLQKQKLRTRPLNAFNSLSRKR